MTDSDFALALFQVIVNRRATSMPLEPKVKPSGDEQGLNRWRRHLEQRLRRKKESGVPTVRGTDIPLTELATSSTSVELYTAGDFTGYAYKPVGSDTDQAEEDEPIVRSGPGEHSEGGN